MYRLNLCALLDSKQEALETIHNPQCKKFASLQISTVGDIVQVLHV